MDPNLPLCGIRVLDCSRVYAGPIASMLLGDLGAQIWKLEPPGGDETRGWGPPFWGDPAEGRSAYFASVNRNKRSLVVDLKTDAGRALSVGQPDRGRRGEPHQRAGPPPGHRRGAATLGDRPPRHRAV